MNYPLKPKQHKNPHIKPALIVVIGVCMIAGALFLSGSNALFSTFGTIGRPIWKIEQGVGSFFSSHLSYLRGEGALIQENTNLKQQLNNLSAVATERDSLLSQVNALKAVTGETLDGEVVSVLSSPANSHFDVSVMELKANSGVQVGDTVFGPDQVVLGQITSRSGSLAQMEYFSSPGKTTLARIGKDTSELTLTGTGGGDFIATIPRSLAIEAGDIVTLPAFNTSIIGRVASVEPARADSFKNVYISYPMNIFNLSWVRISHAR